MPGARVTGLAHAVPPAVDHQALWDSFFRDHYRGDRRAERIWRSAGVRRRHAVAVPPELDVSTWGTGARMRRYAAEAPPLGKEAVTAALDRAGLTPGEVGMLAVVSCTGYITPGIDILLARDLGMPDNVQRLLVGHMGCYAALPGLGAASDFVVARGRPAVLLCVELPSLHIQPAPDRPLIHDDLEQAVAHALFGDAAAAAVLDRGVGAGLDVVSVAARTEAAASDHMTWDVTDLGFRMGLSPRVPQVLAEHARPVVTELLAEHGLGIGDVAAWAVHPGGPRIVEVVGEQLGLSKSALQQSYQTLRDYGNCSSATVLLVLERLTAGLRPGDPAVALAFGPGLTLYAALLVA
ncbi:MAG: type III polyketide synthase [Streptosporangiales bacterium]|nr:type III polyketide synthase [Streptosporangiales bacterium]